MTPPELGQDEEATSRCGPDADQVPGQLATRAARRTGDLRPPEPLARVSVVVPSSAVVHCRIKPCLIKAAPLRAAAPGRASRRACGPAGPVPARRGGHSAYDRHCLHDLPRVADHIDDTNSDRLLREIPFTPSQSPPQALGSIGRMRPCGGELAA